MKILESELRQIIIEALEEEEIDEVIGGLRALAGRARGAVGSAVKSAKNVYSQGEYNSSKEKIIQKTLNTLMKLSKSASQFEQEEEFKKSLSSAIDSLARARNQIRSTNPTARRSAANAAARAARDAQYNKAVSDKKRPAGRPKTVSGKKRPAVTKMGKVGDSSAKTKKE